MVFFFFRIEAISSVLGSASPAGFLYLIGPGILSGGGGRDFGLARFLAWFLAMRLPGTPVSPTEQLMQLRRLEEAGAVAGFDPRLDGLAVAVDRHRDFKAGRTERPYLAIEPRSEERRVGKEC